MKKILKNLAATGCVTLGIASILLGALWTKMKSFLKNLAVPGYMALGIFFVLVGTLWIFIVITNNNFKYSLLMSPVGGILVFVYLLFIPGAASVWTNFSTKIKVENFLRLSLCFIYCLAAISLAMAFQKFPSGGVIVSQDLEVLREVRGGWNNINELQHYSFVSFFEWKYKMELPYMELAKQLVYKKFDVVILLKPMDNARFTETLGKKDVIENASFALVHRHIRIIAENKIFPFLIGIPNDSILFDYVEKIEVRR